MKTAAILKDVNYGDKRPVIQALLETDFSKEIRIMFKAKQVLKEHKTPFPIVVEVVAGKIDFGVNEEVHRLERGDLITLSASVPHDLTAHEDSVVRLTVSKFNLA
jgi:quercetin dioxygenase-like cupin family protein